MAVDKFQDQVRGSYIAHLMRMDRQLFNVQEQDSLHTILKQMVFKPMVFGSFGEMSSNVKD
jgi:hypothetical protein